MIQWFKKSPYIVETQITASRGKLDERSETWLFVMDYARSELEKLRTKNDSSNNSEIQTAVIRGRIKALKDIMDLSKAKKGILSELAD